MEKRVFIGFPLSEVGKIEGEPWVLSRADEYPFVHFYVGASLLAPAKAQPFRRLFSNQSIHLNRHFCEGGNPTNIIFREADKVWFCPASRGVFNQKNSVEAEYTENPKRYSDSVGANSFAHNTLSGRINSPLQPPQLRFLGSINWIPAFSCTIKFPCASQTIDYPPLCKRGMRNCSRLRAAYGFIGPFEGFTQ